jgi:hypothetical protein
MRLPDFSQSRVVLIGTASYDRDVLADLPAAAHNVAALRQRLTDPALSGFSSDNCVTIIDPKHPGQVLEPVQSAADQAQDVFLVYFAGHGLLDREGELHLGLRRSHEQQPWTSVRFAQLAEQILESGALSKIVVLDCCYSGRAMQNLHMAEANLVAEATAQLDIEGLYVLTSSSGNKRSLAPEGEMFTAFTGRMLEFIDAGVPGPHPLLTMESLYTAVRGEMRRRTMPRPQQHSGNNSGQAALVRNRAFVPVEPVPVGSVVWTGGPIEPGPDPAEGGHGPSSVHLRRWRTAAAWLCSAVLTAGMSGSVAVDPSVLAPCAAPLPVRMLVPLDAVEMFRDIADAYEFATRGAGDCRRVSVTISAASRADVSKAFALSWKTSPDGPEENEQLLRRMGPAPDVWIADLSVDMAAVQSALQKTAGAQVEIPGDPRQWPTARSPLVLAEPGDPGTDPAPGIASFWSELVSGQDRGPHITGVVRPDPDTTTVGRLVNVLLYPPGQTGDRARRTVQQPLDSAASDAGVGIGAPDTAQLLCRLRGGPAKGGPDRRTGLIVAEWQVVRYNINRTAGGRCGTAQQNVPVSAWYPQDTTWLDYPLVEPRWRLRQSDQVRRATHDFTVWLRSEAGARVFADRGLRPRTIRPESGIVPGNGVLNVWNAKPRYEPGTASLDAAQSAYEAAKKPASVLIAIDGSGSMAAVSGRRTRFAAAVDGIIASIDTMGERDTFGLFIFSTAVSNDIADVVRLRPGAGGSKRATEEAKGYKPAGGTPLYRAIDHGVQALRAEKRQDDSYRILVVLTDGEDTTGHQLPTLNDDSIRVVVVNVGMSGCPDPQLSTLTSAHGACVGVPADRVDAEVGEQIERLWQKAKS